MTVTDQKKYGLDEANNNGGYVLGRVCALLEEAEEEATSGKEHTVKNYTGQVWETPCVAHPQQFLASLRHFDALERRSPTRGYYYRDEVCRLMASIPLTPDWPLPMRLSQENRGTFWLGYYHQVASFRLRKSKEEA